MKQHTIEREILKNLDIRGFYGEEVEKFKPNSSGTKGMGLCPFHEDTNPSLSVNLETGVFHCFGCGEKGDIISFYMKINEVDKETARKKLAERAEVERSNGDFETTNTNKTIIDQYDYVDEEGKRLFQTVRYEPKDFRQRRPDGKGGWIWDLDGVRLVPYNLPDIINAKYLKITYKGKALSTLTSPTVFITEGEKDANTLKELGLLATCNPMGAGNWRPEFNQYFKGKRIFILPDNDTPGRNHALQVAKNLHGIAESVKIVELPGLREKGDAFDWIQNGGSKEVLMRLVESIPEWTPFSFLAIGSDLMKLDTKIEWLIEKLVPEQSITLLHGRGGIGKTWLCLLLADSVSKGTPFMELITKKSPVIYIDFENSLPVLVERVRKLGVSDTLFWHLSNPQKPPKLDSNDWEQYKDLPKHGLLIFDTLRASQGMEENSSKEMAFILNRLKELREKGFTIIILHHTPKSNERTYKGSTAILDLADHVLSLTKVKKGQPEKEVDDEDTDCYYRFGTKDKTRYKPFHIFMEFVPDKGFALVSDPEEEDMRAIRELMAHLKKVNKEYPNQKYFCEECKKGLNFSHEKTRRLLRKGTDKYWSSERGQNNAIIYKPVFGFLNNISKVKPKKLKKSISAPINDIAIPHSKVIKFPKIPKLNFKIR